MNAPFLMAQATGTTVATEFSAQSKPRVIKVEKPQNNQAVTIHLDGDTKIDLSDIASDKITFVRVGERLVVLFDNQATVTIEPVFGSDGQFNTDIAFQVGSDRVLNGAEFAAAFPIGTDQSILPAAGEGGSSPASGAHFADAAVDPLGPVTLNALLGPEAFNGTLPGEQNFRAENASIIIGTADVAIVDEDGLTHGNPGGPGDVAGEPISFTGSLHINLGQDIVGRTIEFSASQPGLGGLTSGGQEVHIALGTIGGEPALIGYIGDDATLVSARVFVITLDSGPVDGAYSVTLLKPLDHPIHGTEDTLDLTVSYVATNGHGATASGTLTVEINDDSPTVAAVDDQTLVEISTTGEGDTPAHFIPQTTGAVSLDVKWGADDSNSGAANRSLAFNGISEGGAVLDSNGHAVTADGAALHYHFATVGDQTVLVAYRGEDPNLATNQVFTVTLDDTAEHGSYTFNLLDNLDHPTGGEKNDLPFTFSVTATDADGDPVDTSFTVHVTDDVPTVNSSEGIRLSLTEQTQQGGSNAFIPHATDAVALNINWGADDANPNAGSIDRKLSLTDLPTGLTSGGVAITYSFDADTSTLTASAGDKPIFTIELNDTGSGSFVFTLLGPLDHPANPPPSEGQEQTGQNDLPLTFGITATDADGDPADAGTFTVHVIDDVPVASPISDIDITEQAVDGVFVQTVNFPASLNIDWNSDDNNILNALGIERSVAFAPNTRADLLAMGLTSDGETIDYALNGDGTVLTATAGDRVIFTVTLSDAKFTNGQFFSIDNGTYTFALSDNIDHFAANSDSLALHFSFIATDADGDSVTSNFTVNIDDLGPSFDATAVQNGFVDEDGLQGGNAGEPSDASYAGSDQAGENKTADGALGVTWGADDNNSGTIANRALAFSGISEGSVVRDADGNALSSDGSPLHYHLTTFDGEPALIAYKGDDYSLTANQVFTVTLDDTTSTGTYHFTLTGNLDHSTTTGAGVEDDIVIKLAFVATDADNDPVDGSFTVTINDDAPVAHIALNSAAAITLDESVGANPNDPNATADDDVSANPFSSYGTPFGLITSPSVVTDTSSYGADDGAAKHTEYALTNATGGTFAGAATGLTVTGGHAIYLYTDADGNIVGREGNHSGADADGDVAFVLHIDASTGEVTVAQYLAIKHGTAGSTEAAYDDTTNGVLSDLIHVTATVTDSDNDSSIATSSGALTVTFQDDGPALTTTPVEVTSDEGDILTLLSQGSTPNDGNEDGSYTGGPFAITGPAEVSGSLSTAVDFGTDGAAAGGGFSFITAANAIAAMQALGLTSKGSALSYAIVGNELVAYVNGLLNGYQPLLDRTVFTLDLNSNGDFEFKQYDQLDHRANANVPENFELRSGSGSIDAIDFGSIIKATDGDGDSVVLNGQLLVQVRDDVPVVLLAETGFSTTIDETGGSYKDNTTSSSVRNQFVGHVTNTGTDSHNPDFPSAIYARGDLAVVSAGSPLGADDPRTTTLSLRLNDTLDLSANGGLNSGLLTTHEKTAIYLFKEGDLIVGRYDSDGNGTIDKAAFAIAIDQSGHISIAQYVAIVNPDASNNPDNIVDLDGTSLVPGDKILAVATTSDYDGDTVESTTGIGERIRFADDGPTASNSNHTVQLDDDDVTGNGIHGNPGLGDNHHDGAGSDDVAPKFATGTLIHDYGADGPGLTVLTDTGAPSGFTYDLVNPITLNIYQEQNGTNVLVLTVNLSDPVSGQYSVTQIAPIEHGESDATENNIDLAINYKVIDGDADSAIGTLHINVDDDSPIVGTATINAPINENDLPSGNDSSKEPLFVTGDLAISWGADSANPDVDGHSHAYDRQVTFDAGLANNAAVTVKGDESQTLTSDGHKVLIVRVSDTEIYGIADDTDSGQVSVNGRQVFHITISDQDTGGYKFTLLGPIDHPDSGTDDLTFTFGVNAIDADGDSVPTTFSVDVRDDVPLPPDITVVPAAVGGSAVLIADETAGVQSGGPDADAPSDTLHESDVAALPLVFDGANVLANAGTGINFARHVGAVTTVAHYGADGAGTTTLALTQADGAAFTGQGTNFFDTATGHRIYLYTDTETGIVVGRVGTDGSAHSADPNGAISFAFAIGNDGTLSMVEYLALQHPDAANRDEPITLHAANTGDDILYVTATSTDGDNDTASSSAALTIRVQDDAPLATATILTGAVYESELSRATGDVSNGTRANGADNGDDKNGDGGTDDSILTGNLSSLVSMGADGGTFVVEKTNLSSSLTSLTSHGVPLTYTVDSVTNTLTAWAGSNKIFTFAVDATTGDYTFTLTGPLDNTGHAQIDGHSVPLTSVDAIGSTVTVGEISGNAIAFEGRLPDGDAIIKVTNSGNIPVSWTLHNADGGPDYAVTIAAHSSMFVNVGPFGTPPNVDFYLLGEGVPGDNHTVVNNGHGTFTVVGTSNDAFALDLSSAVTARDGDGDTVALHDQLVISVVDDVPAQTGTPVTGEVTEVGLSNRVSNDSHPLKITYGADGIGSLLTFAVDNHGDPLHPTGLTSDGVALAYKIQILPSGEEQLVAYKSTETVNDPVFIVTLNSPVNPTYVFTLYQNLDHDAAHDTSLPVSFTVVATDSDGDTVQQSFTVNIADSAPTIDTPDSKTVVESTQNTTFSNAFVTASAIGSLAINWGADDANPTAGAGAHDRSVAFDAALSGQISTATSDGYHLIYKLSADGMTLTAYRIFDGMLNGTDGVHYISSGGGDFGTTISNAARVFTVQLSDSGSTDHGAYTFTLYDSLDHASGDSANDLALDFGFTATDTDGDSTPASFTVHVTDDTPVRLGDADVGVIDEVEVAGFPRPSTFGSLNIDWNADSHKAHLEFADKIITDGAGHPLELTSGGTPLEYDIRLAANGIDQELVAYKQGDTAANPVFIATLNAAVNAAFSFTELQPLDHNGSYGDTLPLTFNVTGYDGDQDPVTTTFTVNINDSGPSSLDVATVAIEEAAGSVSTGAVDLKVSYGGDGDSAGASVTFAGGAPSIVDQAGNPISTLTSLGIGLKYVLSADGATLIAYRFDGTNYVGQDGGLLGSDISGATNAQVFTVALSDAGTGSYNFTLLQPLDHPAPAGTPTTGSQYIDLTFAFQIEDGDQDTFGNDFTVRVDAAGSATSMRYDAPATSGVFVNLSDISQTVNGETVAAHSVTDRASVADKVVGIDQLGTVTNAYGSNSDDILVGGAGANKLVGNDGNDIIIGGAGNDNLIGGAGNDTFLYTVGDGADIIDGGDQTGTINPNYDIFSFTGDSQARSITIAGATTGTNIVPTSGADATDVLVTYDGTNGTTVRMDGIEHIDINAATGALNVSIGDVSGTALLPSTIAIHGGSAGDTVDLSNFNGDVHVVYDGAGGTDTVNFGDLQWKDTTITRSGDTFTITADGHTFDITNVENFEFANGTATADMILEAPPVIGDATLSVAENSAGGTVVGSVTSIDANGFLDDLNYSFVGGTGFLNTTSADGKFIINVKTGEITVADGVTLDYETTPSFSESVRVTDVKGGYDDAQVTINVTNVNESAIIGGVYTGSVTEDVALGHTEASENFESYTISDDAGWNNGFVDTTNAPSSTKYLTEYDFQTYDGQQSVARDFAIQNPGSPIAVDFDFYKIDRWQGDSLLVFLNGQQAFAFEPEGLVPGGQDGATGTFTLPNGLHGTYTITSSGTDAEFANVAGADSGDRVYHIHLDLDSTGGTLTLGFGNTITSATYTDTFGIDNIKVVSDPTVLFAQGDLTITDPDAGEAHFITQASVASYGTFTLTADGHWTYRADNNNPAIQALGSTGTLTDSFTAVSQDGTASQVVTVTIHGTNDAPVVTAGGTAAYAEGDPAILIGGAVTLADIDSPTLHGATVEISGNFAGAEDHLNFVNQNGISGVYNAANGTLTLTGDATLADYQAALQSITYSNSSTNPSGATRTISFQVDDGDAANHLSNVATSTVTVTPLNEAPVNGVPGAAQSTNEDTALVFSTTNGNAITVSDSDGDTLTVTLSGSKGTLTLSGINGLAFSEGDGTADDAMTFTGTAFAINAALNGLSFAPTANYSGDASIRITTSDGTATDIDAVAITVNAVADAPSIAVANAAIAPTPEGGAFQVNTVVTGSDNQPAVAALTGGGFIETWQSYNLDQDPLNGIYGQRFDAHGNKVGDEFHVNTYTTHAQQDVQVAGLQNGGFVAVWNSDGQDGSAFGVYARIYDASGNPLTAQEFRVNTATDFNQQKPDVAVLTDGSFVITWSSAQADGLPGYDIYAQHYSATGTPIGGETLLNVNGTFDDQTEPSITALTNGNYVVTWMSGGVTLGANPSTVVAQVFHADGTAASSQLTINAVGAGGQGHTEVSALATGGFVATWQEFHVGLGYDVMARVYDAAGQAVGGAVQVNTSTAGDQEWPEVLGLADGGFIVAWDGSPGGTPGIFMQRFDSHGVAVGGETQISTGGSMPELAQLASGAVVATWYGGNSYAKIIDVTQPTGTEDQPFNLPVTISLTDTNGTPNEVLSQVRIHGLPAGFTLAVGEREGGNPSGDWIIDRSTTAESTLLDQLAAHTGQLTVTPATDFSGTLNLEVTATSQEPSNGSTANSLTTLVPVLIAPVEDAPVNTVAGPQSVNEDTALHLAGAISVHDNDGDLATTQLTVQHGTLHVDLAGGATIGTGANDSATLTLSGTEAQINAALQTLSYQGSANYNGSDAIKVVSTDATGLSDTDTVNIQVNPVNDLPVAVGDSGTMTENDSAKVFDVLTNDTRDPDAGAPNNITISTVRVSGLSGTDYNTLLDPANSGLFTITVTDDNRVQVELVPSAWDKLANGATAHIYVGYTLHGDGTDTAYNELDVLVTGVNDAPVLLTAPSPAISTFEDAAAPVDNVGTLVSTLIDPVGGSVGNVADPDPTLPPAMVITSLDTSHGTWYWSSNNGATWNQVSSLATGQALYLLPTDELYFKPAADYNGTIDQAITFHAWDRSQGYFDGLSGAPVNYGGTTPYSTATDTISVTVNPVNDKPVYDLDADDSSGKAGLDYQTSYTGGGAAAHIADADSHLTDVDSTLMHSATITLTNALVGDALNIDVSTLSNLGITGAVDTSVNGKVTVTLTGDSSLANYESAIESVTFSSTGSSAADRTVTVTVSDGSASSDVATTTIHVTPAVTSAVAHNDTISLIPTGWSWLADNGHIYKYDSTNTTWSNAVTLAAGQIAGVSYLATSTSAAEDSFIDGLVNGQRTHLGASDATTEGTWMWVTGPEAGTVFWQGGTGGSAVNGAFTKWGAGNPNNLSGGGEDEDYLATDVNNNWNDVSASNSQLPSIGYTAEAGGNGQTYAAINEDAPFSFSQSWLLSNDANAPSTIMLVDAHSASGATVSFNSATGMITYDASGSATLQALDAGQSATDTFNYTISDGHGGTSIAQVTVTVAGADEISSNAAPHISSFTTGTVTEDATPAGANLVQNPGFESINDQTATIYTWTQTGTKSGFGIGSAGSDGAHSGASGAALSTSVNGGAVAILSQTFNTVEGQHYTLSYWLADQIVGGASTFTSVPGFDSFVAYWGNAAVAGSSVASTPFSLVDPYVANTSPYGFTLYTFDVVGGPGTQTTLSLIGSNPLGTWYVDDVAVQAVPKETASGTVKFTDSDASDTHTVSVDGNLPADYVGTFTATPTSEPQNGTPGVVTWTFTASETDLQFLAAGQTKAQYYTVNITDGQGGTTSQVVEVDLVGRNDAPVITANNTTSYVMGSAAIAISPGATITDIDSANFGGGKLTVALDQNTLWLPSSGQLTVHNVGTGAGQISVSGSNVSYEGTLIGMIDSTFNGVSGTNLIINLNDHATQAATQALVDDIYFSASGLGANSGGSRWAVTYTLTDGDGTAGGGTDTATALANIYLTTPSPATATAPVPGVQSGIDYVAFDANGGVVKATISQLSTSDIFMGGPGVDTLEITNTGTVSDNTLYPIWGEFDVLRLSAAGNYSVTLGTNANAGFSHGMTIDHAGLSGNLVIAASSFTHDLTVLGGTGNDMITGGSGNDTFRGGAGNDTYDGKGGTDLLDFSDATGAINFTLTNGPSQVTVDLSAVGLGNDKYQNMEGVIGSNFDDVLTGSGLNDIIRGGGGNDTIDGGAGTDLVDFTGGTAGITFTLTQSNSDTVGPDLSAAGLGTDTYKNIEGVIGTAFADHLTGSALNDIIRGGGGNDIIDGGDGNDTLDGGAGADTISGGAGNDILIADQNDLVLDGGADIDTLQVSTNFTSTSDAQIVNIENVTLTTSGLSLDLSNQSEGFTITGSSGSDTIFGSSGADTINGGAGNDTLFGGAGDDFLTGGAGVDILMGGKGADHFVYNAPGDTGTTAASADHILDFSISEGDKFEISAVGFNVAVGSEASVFGSSADNTFGSPTERFHFNTATHTLLYDSNGSSSAAATTAVLAVLDNAVNITNAQIHFS